MQMNLSSGLENYIEVIYLSSLSNVQMKGADLARKLAISRASVSEAMAKLVLKGLITYDENKSITLTELGEKEAKKIYSKHNILQNFFEKVLSIPSDIAEKNACSIEHIISKQILDKMETFTTFFEDNKQILDSYTPESEKLCRQYHQ